MKKYLFYTLFLVALLIVLSSTISRAEETGDLRINFQPEENYILCSSTQRIGLTIKLSNNGEPLSGTYQLVETNVKNPTGNITFSSEGEVKLIKTLADPDPSSPYIDYFSTEASVVIKNIPVGTTYEIIPDEEDPQNNNSSRIEYYTTDNETAEISDGNIIVNYTLKPKQASIKVNYLDINPDYDAPDLFFLLNLYSRSFIPPSIHYYYSSNPDELIEMTKRNGTDFTTGQISLKEGESIVITDAPLGIQFYTTPESLPNPYMCRYSQSQSGTVWGSLEYYYWDWISRDPTKLTILKTSSGTGVDTDKEYKFKLTASAYQQDGSYKNLNSTYLYDVIDQNTNELIETRETQFNDGVAYVTCKIGQKIEIGTIKDIQDVDFNVSGVETSEIDFACKLHSLTKIQVEEVDADEYSSTVALPAIFDLLPATIEICNTRKTGNLTISKEILGNISEDEEFTFTIKLTDETADIPTEYEYTGSKEGTLVFEDGVATITLKADESITIVGLPLNATYQIEEETDEYDVSYDSQEGKITEETSVTITNSIKQEEETVDEESVEEVKEDDPKDPAVPHTGDYVVLYSLIGLAGLILAISIKKKIK